ncbi:MAG: hypothetical protein JSW28_01665 [Thermoplasmata archaeon]|nr:MAG: hypothetical protein JSW28_01665 [Thermoplasmata archaeon]
MPEEEERKDEKTSETEDEKSELSGKRPISPEEALKTYISAYIDSYMDLVEELNIKEGDFPLLYAYYPLEAKGYILPDNSTCILFRGLAAATLIEVEKADFEAVDREIIEKRYDYICCYPSSQSYTRDGAAVQAKKDVEEDMEHVKKLGTVSADRAAKDENLKSIRLLSVALPWITARGEEKGALKIPPDDHAKLYSFEGLKMKEDEYFSGYSERLDGLEKALFYGAKIEPAPSKPPAVSEAAMTTKQVPDVTTAASLAAATAAQAPPGTHVSIEIKQPEAKGKEEILKDRTEEDLLRIKKTLYTQTLELEEIKRANQELSNKLGNFEQMRQTVFRINRKVFDSDAKLKRIEKNNRETLRKFAELRTEQKEENKKMRRFIAERAKKARNQALTIAGIALALSVVSLIFLIPLLMRFWDEIKSVLGI